MTGNNESSDAGSCHFEPFWLFFFQFITDTSYRGARAPKNLRMYADSTESQSAEPSHSHDSLPLIQLSMNRVKSPG